MRPSIAHWVIGAFFVAEVLLIVYSSQSTRSEIDHLKSQVIGWKNAAAEWEKVADRFEKQADENLRIAEDSQRIAREAITESKLANERSRRLLSEVTR